MQPTKQQPATPARRRQPTRRQSIRQRRAIATWLLAALVLVVLPAGAVACVIPIRTVGPVDVVKGDLVRPKAARSTRSAWGLGAEWSSGEARLEQLVRTRRSGTHHGVSFPRQRAISIDAMTPDRYVLRLEDDDDPTTPQCALAGRPDWSDPVVRVRETSTTVHVLAAVRPTPGDRSGCQAATSDDLECPQLVRHVVQLQRPVGDRRILIAHF